MCYRNGSKNALETSKRVLPNLSKHHRVKTVMLCFAILLEKGPEEVHYSSATTLMEIAAVAEDDADLRRSTFKLNSPACKAVIDQQFSVLEKRQFGTSCYFYQSYFVMYKILYLYISTSIDVLGSSTDDEVAKSLAEANSHRKVGAVSISRGYR